MPNTIQIPLSAPVDLETKSIIQSDFSFTRKNSILHQGLLSNMKSKTGQGILSTTGKDLYAYDKVVADQYINGDAVKTFEIKETEGEIVASASSPFSTYSQHVLTVNIVQISIDTFRIKIYREGELKSNYYIQLKLATTYNFTPITSSFDITHANGGYFAAIGVFNDAEGNTLEWRAIIHDTTVVSQTFEKTELKLGGEVQIAYDGSIWVGFEDVDVRKRCSYCYTDINQFYSAIGKESDTSTYSARIPGFGTLSKTCICREENGTRVYSPVLITGEPLFAEVHYERDSIEDTSFWAHQDAEKRDDTPYDTTQWKNKYMPMQYDWQNIDYNSSSENPDPHLLTNTLENGIIQISPLYDTYTTLTYEEWTDDSTHRSRGFGGDTIYPTPQTLLKGIKNDPDTVDGNQAGVSAWPSATFFDIAGSMKVTRHYNNGISMRRGLLCYYAFISDKEGSFFSKTFNALDRAYLPNAFVSQVPVYTTRFAGAKTGTAISFCDYDNPIGLLGDAITDVTSDQKGQQLFPHARWFCNDTTKKGIHWDYGRGWTTFIKDTIEVYRMGNSFRVFERPLELWRFTTEEASSFNKSSTAGATAMSTHPVISFLDIVSKEHGEFSLSRNDMRNYFIEDVAIFDRWGVDNIGNSRNTVIKETEFVGFPGTVFGSSSSNRIRYSLSTSSSYGGLFTGFEALQTKVFINGEWQTYEDYIKSQGINSAYMTDILLIQNQYYPGKSRLLRYHPITESQITSTTWKYSHHLGGEGINAILSAVPWSFGYWMGIQYNQASPRMQIYNGEIVSVSLNDVLMTTPHDLKNKYSFIVPPSGMLEGIGRIGFTMWNGDTVNICYPDYSTDYTNTDFTKMADYTFKSPYISKYPNVLLEKRNGSFKLSKAFIPYIMDSIIDTANKGFAPKLPQDSDSMISNDTYMYGFGYNVNATDEDAVSSSFLLPAVVVSNYCDADDLYKFNSIILNGRKGLFRADVRNYFAPGYPIDEYYTHSQASTDITYKNSREYVSYYETKDKYREELANTSWWLTTETVLYPVGYLSKTYGENYITSTVDVGDNYVSRFYRNNNKTLLNFNMKDTVYYGSEIFTIQSGNYYFDGQGIYYLGSQSDYSQNIFTAYAIGMKFLANSSSEAYFYSEWDKSLYLYTASNTLQKAQSLADMGEIVDSLYGSAEQALYILFDDGKLFIKTQSDSCIIENVQGKKLQATNVGVFVVGDTTYEIHNPHLWEGVDALHIETEWLGNSDTISKYQYVDIVLYSDEPVEKSFNVTVQALNGGVVEESVKKVTTNTSDWKNKLCRVRVVPKEIVGNAVKVKIDSEDDISIFSLSISVEQTSTIPSASRNKRY